MTVDKGEIQVPARTAFARPSTLPGSSAFFAHLIASQPHQGLELDFTAKALVSYRQAGDAAFRLLETVDLNA